MDHQAMNAILRLTDVIDKHLNVLGMKDQKEHSLSDSASTRCIELGDLCDTMYERGFRYAAFIDHKPWTQVFISPTETMPKPDNGAIFTPLVQFDFLDNESPQYYPVWFQWMDMHQAFFIEYMRKDIIFAKFHDSTLLDFSDGERLQPYKKTFLHSTLYNWKDIASAYKGFHYHEQVDHDPSLRWECETICVWDSAAFQEFVSFDGVNLYKYRRQGKDINGNPTLTVTSS